MTTPTSNLSCLSRFFAVAEKEDLQPHWVVKNEIFKSGLSPEKSSPDILIRQADEVITLTVKMSNISHLSDKQKLLLFQKLLTESTGQISFALDSNKELYVKAIFPTSLTISECEHYFRSLISDIVRVWRSF